MSTEAIAVFAAVLATLNLACVVVEIGMRMGRKGDDDPAG